MKIHKILIAATFLAGSTLGLSAKKAEAFSFTTDSTYNGDATADIELLSVDVNGFNIAADELSYVDRVDTKLNDGGASLDAGDNAQGIVSENPTDEQFAETLGNNYLSQIIDGEDSREFAINVFFETPVNTLFLWERGKNSKLGVVALDEDGNEISDELTLNFSQYSSAGYKLNTAEINSAQSVSSTAISLEDFSSLTTSSDIAGFQFIARRGYRGPDFKVIGYDKAFTKDGKLVSTPEPGTILGLGLLTASLAASRIRKVKKA